MSRPTRLAHLAARDGEAVGVDGEAADLVGVGGVVALGGLARVPEDDEIGDVEEELAGGEEVEVVPPVLAPVAVDPVQLQPRRPPVDGARRGVRDGDGGVERVRRPQRRRHAQRLP